MTSTGCGLSDGLSGRMFRTAGEEGGSEEGGERTVEGRGETKPREARSSFLTTYFNPLNRLPSAPAFFFFCYGFLQDFDSSSCAL